MVINILSKTIHYTKKALAKFFIAPKQIIEQVLFDFYRIFFKIRVFDCFIFHNELEMLKLRLDYLNDVVDVFVIVEAKLTFTNKEKEKYNAESFIKKLPNQIRNKIRYIQLNPFQFPIEIRKNPWKMETFVRNAISFGLGDIKNFDFLWLSDVDEIPDKQKVFKLGRLSMFFSYYKMNLLKKQYWIWSKAILGKHMTKSNPQKIRMKKWNNGIYVKKAGWHFSYLMSKEDIREKVQSFAHSEFNKEEFINLKKIEESIKSRKDLFGRSEENLYIEKDLSFLPDTVKYNLENYKHFIEN